MAVTPISVSPSLASVLNAAGDRSDVDFDYLLKTAERESSLNPQAKAASSSATGLFQFLDTTWLQVMKSEGAAPRLPGLCRRHHPERQRRLRHQGSQGPRRGAEAAREPDGRRRHGRRLHQEQWRLSQGKIRPHAEPRRALYRAFPRAPGGREDVRRRAEKPDQVAAQLFPQAATANPTIFYDHGRARTIREVYHALVAQHQAPNALHPGFAAQQMAAQATAPRAAGSSRYRWRRWCR